MPEPTIAEVEALVRKVPVLVDVGPGIRPQTQYSLQTYVGVEPHGEYADVLESKGLFVLRTTIAQALPMLGTVDSIIMLDVLEHMERALAEVVLRQCKQLVRQQLVVFTTLGFIPQEPSADGRDAWGMQGAFWQKHRSGWQPKDFEGWQVAADPNFHGARGGAIFAVYDKGVSHG